MDEYIYSNLPSELYRVHYPGSRTAFSTEQGFEASDTTIRPIRLRTDGTKLISTTDTHRLTSKDNLSMSSTNKKTMQQSADASLRRSTRISKQSERFCPEYA